MTVVELFPADVHNQKTIQQGHPPNWINREGGEYDLVVLGGGPAGLVSAMTAAAEGHRVAMTEQRLTGGTCVNFGCTPSKALIRCARAVHDAGRGAEFGFRLDGPPRADFGAVMERVRRMRSLSRRATPFWRSKRPAWRCTSGTPASPRRTSWRWTADSCGSGRQ
jgi:Pyridine nucleotide-disulphide oxidoreductase